MQTEPESRMRELLNDVAHGDELALADLYRLLNHKIQAFVTRFFSEPHLVDEVVVETMYEVWRNAKNFSEGSKVSTWVLGIARHKALDKCRQRELQDKRDGGSDDVINDLPSCNPSALNKIIMRQTTTILMKCLDALPQSQRECIHLAFYEGLSLKEIAEIQGIPENTIKTRLFYARKQLRAKLETQLEDVETPWSQMDYTQYAVS
jgi:RNA polymerase sigma-70 factor, ECF subfamily